MVSATGGSRQLEVPADKINLGFLLDNKVAFGSVNVNREYFETGVKDLSTAELQYPGWLKKLLTHPRERIRELRGNHSPAHRV